MRFLQALALIVGLAAPSFAGQYFNTPVTSTATGTAWESISGQFYFAASSANVSTTTALIPTKSTWTITLNGATGTVIASTMSAASGLITGNTFSIGTSTFAVAYGSVSIGTTTFPSAFTVYTTTTVLTMGPWTNWTPTITGYTNAGTINYARYQRVGKTFNYQFSITGTSNSTSFSLTIPYAALGLSLGIYACEVEDGSNWQSAPGEVLSTSNTAVLTLSLTFNQNLTAWTNSGTKAARCSGSVEVQ